MDCNVWNSFRNWTELVKKYYIDCLTVDNIKNVFASQGSLQGRAPPKKMKIAPIIIFTHVLYV